ncbi:CLC voltage-gated chloride channel [Skeletonema marinoi]|uniref:CLC voltage-gated chloride channel n=1 Tax=Skeletonema marinoi TaxID=267567 RepID=A0AAD9DC85_9STRA|nr:CLC voltage-gated chloride channel [Skeletonema marinoi]
MKAKAPTSLSLLLLLILTYSTSGHFNAKGRAVPVLVSDTSSATTAFVRPQSNQPSALPISIDADGTDDGILFRQAAIIGIVTAAMGHVYGHILDGTVKGVWKYVPNYLQKRGILDNAVGHWYIPMTCSIGGLIMGILSIKLKPSFVVADFVRALSGSDADMSIFPTKLMPALSNLLLLSLVTSTFGFSVGPEAPMVCAGGLVGKALSNRWNNECNTKTLIGCNRDVIMTYAGAAGALTAFMGIPLAGSIFALELTRASAGMASAATDALVPAVVASVAALALIRGIADPHSSVGGHFRYLSSIPTPSGRITIVTSLVCGIGGAFIATIFHKSVHFLKDVLWSELVPDDDNAKDGSIQASFQIHREVLVKTAIGIAVGALSMKYPTTMFWGEGSLQTAIDGQRTPFADTKHGLPSFLTAHAHVDPNAPCETSWAAIQVGVAKLISIALACAGKFPGGIIFPLFFAAAPIANAMCGFFSQHLEIPVNSVAIMALMASTQASVTRTPLATVLMLTLSASPGTELSKILPCVILSSYIGVFCSRYISKESYFTYSK